MSLYEGPVQALIDELGRLPGVGPKSAQRIAFYILKTAPEDAKRLARAIVEAKDRVSWCRTLLQHRRGRAVRVLPRRSARPARRSAWSKSRATSSSVERTGEFQGRYHVLQGAISPIEGVLPDQLRIKELLARIDAESVKEVILATNPNVEGEATAMYLAQLLRPLDLRVTRIASGLPVGGDLEYADEVTLGRAFEGRRELSSLDARATRRRGNRRTQRAVSRRVRSPATGDRGDLAALEVDNQWLLLRVVVPALTPS